jgi:hypothetical protein
MLARKKYLIQVYRLEKVVDNIHVNSKKINGNANCREQCKKNRLEKITPKSMNQKESVVI